MSHLDAQPEDNKNILMAKKLVKGDFQASPQEAARLFIAVLDDRSNWIAKAAELRDTMVDVVAQFTSCNNYERELISLMAGQARELSAMLHPPKEEVIAFGQRKQQQTG